MKIEDMDMPKQTFAFAAIHMLSNRLQVVGDKIDPTISSKQWFLLATISKFTDKPPNIGDIADVLCVSRQNIKKMANILEQHGFLKMEKDKNDLRSIQLFLTDQCSDYFKGRDKLEREYMLEIFDGVDDELLAVFCNGLSKLIKNTDKILEDSTNAER